MSDARAMLLFKAQLAQRVGLWEDVMAAMRNLVVEVQGKLSVEERNLLSLACKKVVERHRQARRIVASIQDAGADDSGGGAGDGSAEEGSKTSHHLGWSNTAIQRYKGRVGDELARVCNDVLDIIDNQLLPAADVTDTEQRVSLLKTKADYLRYAAEALDARDESRKDTIARAEEVYTEALRIAKDNIAPTHPLRLGVMLNFAVFYHELTDKKRDAVLLAKEALRKVMEEPVLDLTDEELNESMALVHLLRDNLLLWARYGNTHHHNGDEQDTAEDEAQRSDEDKDFDDIEKELKEEENAKTEVNEAKKGAGHTQMK